MPKHDLSTSSWSRSEYGILKYISPDGKVDPKKHTEKMRGGIARGRPSASAGAVQQGCPAGERCCLVGTSTKLKRRTSKNATHLMKYLSYDADYHEIL